MRHVTKPISTSDNSSGVSSTGGDNQGVSDSIYTEIGFKLNKMRISVRISPKTSKSAKSRSTPSLKKESSFKSYNSSSLLQSIKNRTQKDLDVSADDWRWQPSPNGSFTVPVPASQQSPVKQSLQYPPRIPSPHGGEEVITNTFSDPVHQTLKTKANVNFIKNDLTSSTGSRSSSSEELNNNLKSCQKEMAPPPLPPRSPALPCTPPPSARPPYPSSTISKKSSKQQQSTQFKPVSGSALEAARRKYCH